MSRGMNMVQLIGNVGNDPEIRATQNGTRVAKFSLATTRQFKDKTDQKREETDWHRVTVWGKLADVVEDYVHKGDKLYVRGRIQYSTSEDTNGDKKYWTDIVVEELLMLGSPGGAGGGDRQDAGGGGGGGERFSAGRSSGRSGGGGGRQEKPLSEPDDDLPF